MSNEDLERDMEARNEADQARKTSTDQDTSDLTDDNKVPEEKTMDMGIEFAVDKEQIWTNLLMNKDNSREQEPSLIRKKLNFVKVSNYLHRYIAN